MKRLIVKGITIAVLVAALIFPPATSAFAGDPHSGGATGQPNQSCQMQPSTPGDAGSLSNLGSPFSPNGQSGTVYAGQQDLGNSGNQAAQYDVACFEVSQ